MLREAAAVADRTSAAHVGSVARIALLSALTRLGRRSEALVLVGPLLQEQRRTGGWPQLWTMLRILAEPLVAFHRTQTAARAGYSEPRGATHSVGCPVTAAIRS